MYTKRIAFLISKQHLIPHGGIGSFAKSFVQMCEQLNWKCDLILDQSPMQNELTHWMLRQNVNMMFPLDALSKGSHNKRFQYADTLNFEQCINFRESLIEAHSKYVYDMIVVNTPEAGPASYILDLQERIPVVYYTHNENSVFMTEKHSGVFNEAYQSISKSMLEYDNLIIGTQSNVNKANIISHTQCNDVRVMPMPIPERGLLDDNSFADKSGILFIGRHEPRKNPSEYIKLIKRLGYPAKVLTSKKHVEKFERDFAAADITDYEIKAGIIGQEKVDFIKSARLAFHPSKLESYGFSAFESLHSCPTIVLKKYNWGEPFKAFTGFVEDDDDSDEVNRDWYEHAEEYYSDTLEQLREHDKSIAAMWNEVITSFKPKSKSQQNTNVLRIVNDKQVSIADLFSVELKRTHITVEDIHSVLDKRPSFNVYQTDSNTYLSVDKFDNTPINNDPMNLFS